MLQGLELMANCGAMPPKRLALLLASPKPAPIFGLSTTRYPVARLEASGWGVILGTAGSDRPALAPALLH